MTNGMCNTSTVTDCKRRCAKMLELGGVLWESLHRSYSVIQCLQTIEKLVIFPKYAQDMKVKNTVRGVLSIPKMGLKFVRPSARSSVKRQDLRLALETVGCSTGCTGGEDTGANGVATAVITGVASGRVNNGRIMSVGSSMRIHMILRGQVGLAGHYNICPGKQVL